VAGVLVVLDLVNILPKGNLEAVTLAVLAMMSINMLLTRIKLDEVAAMRQESEVPVYLDQFPASYEQDWRRLGDLFLYGTSLLDTVLACQQWIAARLSTGGRVRVLLMKPESEAVVLASERCYMRTNHHDDAALKSVISLLSRLAAETGGRIDIRVTTQEPTFTAVYVEPAGAGEVIYLMYYRYRMNSDDQMRLTLRPRNGRWFELHRDQMEHLWRDSEALGDSFA
jgi:hypothetical protein